MRYVFFLTQPAFSFCLSLYGSPLLVRDQAVELAEQHRFSQIEGLLTAYASHLLQKDKLFQAVELYRKANRHTEAAKLLVTLAGQAAKSKVQPLRVKKLYTM